MPTVDTESVRTAIGNLRSWCETVLTAMDGPFTTDSERDLIATRVADTINEYLNRPIGPGPLPPIPISAGPCQLACPDDLSDLFEDIRTRIASP